MTIIYLGTGGYSDPDLIGTLYPKNTTKSQFLTTYTKHYQAVEINSSFHVPIGQKAFAGMLEKTQGQLKFSIKLHQDFSHTLTATPEQATAFLQAIEPIRQANCLASLLLQFPYSFHRTIQNRQYLAKLVNWFTGIPLAIEFRHASWHIQQVLQSFRQRNLIWCSVDYPPVQGLPSSQLLFTNRIGYLRLHGHNLHWWQATTAKERHDYCYQLEQMQALASQIDNYRQHFEVLYIFFENTTKGYAVTNITMLRQALLERGLLVR